MKSTNHQENSRLGIHLRIEKSYTHMLEIAQELGLSSCQFFFILQETGKYLRLTSKDRGRFLQLRKQFSQVYCHTSYWINLSSGDAVSAEASKKILKKEILIAKKLDINYLVLHAGSAKGHPPDNLDPTSKYAGVKFFANALNSVLKKEEDVTILVENTAHANKTICSNLHDFPILRSLIERPERVKFCLDTAHAFAYGYNLAATDSFIELLDQTMGIENIRLIHLNDSAKKCESKIDQHKVPGEGLIGKKTLRKLITHPKLAHLPTIVEPPVSSIEELKRIVEKLKGSSFFIKDV